MKRIVCLGLAIALFCGCQYPTPPGRDPFFGRTTVPPPRTGAASIVDPYVQGGQGRAATIPPAPNQRDAAVPSGTATAGASVASPAANSGWLSAGSAARQTGGTSSGGLAHAHSAADGALAAAPTSSTAGTSTPPNSSPSPSVIRIVEPDPQALAASGKAAASALSHGDTTPGAVGSQSALGAVSGEVSLAGRPRIVRTLQPRPATGDRASPGGSSGTLPGRPLSSGVLSGADGQVVDITELPPVNRGAMVSRAQTTPSQPAASSPAAASGGTGRLVSAERAPGVPSTAAAAVYEQPAGPSSQSLYGHDPQYKWLRGRLEYSQLDRRWKLRYIPIDGQTDRFGGSVILPDEKLLAGCERGDFVEVHGRLGKHDPRKGFAPEYEISSLKRLGR